MSDARKCNKCHKCFDPLEQEGRMARFVNPIFQTSNEIREYVRGQLLFDEMGPDGVVDLCPECSVQFRKFMLGEDAEKLPEDIDKTLWSDQLSEAVDRIVHRFECFKFPEGWHPDPGGDTDGD